MHGEFRGISDPMFGKTFLFKGPNQQTVLREFIKSLRETCNTLNKEMETQYAIDEKIPYSELIKLRKQTHCFVCKERFDEKKHILFLIRSNR